MARDELGKYKQKHGLSRHRLYPTWNDMVNRCHKAEHTNFRYYGGRGIKVCDRWHSVTNFIEDMCDSFEENLSLDRIDNQGNYCPENVRWATRKEQNRNTRVNRSVISTNIMTGGEKFYQYQIDVTLDGFSQGNVSMCCRGVRNHHKLHLFRYA